MVALGPDYLLAMDLSKSVYLHRLSGPQQKQQDKKLAIEIYPNSNFIELYPTESDIWAVNSLR